MYDGARHFQQDNATIHRAQAVDTFFLEHGISVINWPPYSPDSNTIKHV